MKKFTNPFFGEGETPSIKDSSNTVKLTPKLFFGTSDQPGYFTREQFLQYGGSLREKETKDLSLAIGYMKQGLIMGGNPLERPDRGGRIYIHPDFYKSKARVGVKLILEHGMSEFISDYQEGYIHIQFTLDELVAEAKKQS